MYNTIETAHAEAHKRYMIKGWRVYGYKCQFGHHYHVGHPPRNVLQGMRDRAANRNEEKGARWLKGRLMNRQDQRLVLVGRLRKRLTRTQRLRLGVILTVRFGISCKDKGLNKYANTMRP